MIQEVLTLDEGRIIAHVDTGAIKANIAALYSRTKGRAGIMAVLKADGYGHGAIPIARALEDLPHVSGYAVATAAEGCRITDAGLKKPVLILGPVFSKTYEQLAERDIRCSVCTVDALEAASKAKGTVRVHIPVDTGMSRIGIFPDDAGLDFVKRALSTKGVEVEGIFTHLATADEEDLSGALGQKKAFYDFTDRIKNETGISIPLLHCDNSAGALATDIGRANIIRAGIAMYGIRPSAETRMNDVTLRPALTLTSHVTHIKTVPAGTPVSYGGTFVTKKETVIATIPVGYGDGYPRELSGTGEVLIRRKRAPIIGRVCMDQLMADVSDIDGVEVTDRVTLIGSDGDETITLEELASRSGRFHYELLCGLSPRVPRLYL